MALKAFDFVRQYRRADNKLLTGLFFIPGLIGGAAAAIQLVVFNKIFIHAGKIPAPKAEQSKS